ncbi:MAG: GDSL-type esterase/lipase family protein [Planctomycetales bacterium]|nr:GDSL-type esterase/lipase family protein [Planctomycetales bacterium]
MSTPIFLRRGLLALAIATTLLANGSLFAQEKDKAPVDRSKQLKAIMEQFLSATKANDKKKVTELTQAMKLPKPAEFFVAHFGTENARRLSDEYDRLSPNFDEQLPRLFASMLKRNRTNLNIQRHTTPNPKATGNQNNALKAMKTPIALYSVRFVEPGKRLGTHVYNFVHVGGAFRLAGAMRNIAPPPKPKPEGVPIAFPLKAKRVLFLGDSITHAGGFVAWIETQCRLQGVSPMPTFYNVGLSSETCSGQSEPAHPFPRPDVHERLDRVLKRIRPDVVVSCYGMNDGIYHPFSEKRFQIYQDGVNRVIKKVHAAGAKLVLMTPPPFDAVPLKKRKGALRPAGSKEFAYFGIYEHYDRDVISKFAKWIMQQKDRVEMVVDLHTPITKHLAEQRKQKPDYTLSPDGVHPNPLGHRILGDTVLLAWGMPSVTEPDPKLLGLIQQKTSVLHDSYLSAIGHKRPGVKKGLPTEEAEQKAAQLLKQAVPLIRKQRSPSSSQRPSTGGTIHQVHYPSLIQPGRLRIGVDFYLWIPDGVKTLRGVIVHQHGCGVGASRGGRTAADDLHWQALARKWNCALLGSMYEPRREINCRWWCDSRNGSNDRFLECLEHFAAASSHPELKTAPWCLWGHSGGGFWASLVQARHPERVVAIWFRSGTAFGYWTKGETVAPKLPRAAYGIPMIGNPGLKEKDDARFHTAWDGLRDMRAAYLKRGAVFFEFAPDPRTAHQCGDSRYMAIPFFDFWLEHRLPQIGQTGRPLRPAAPAVALWGEHMAGKLAEYIKTGAVSDTTPPPAPSGVQVKRLENGQVEVTWQAAADFESGIRAFVIERGGKRVGQVPEKPSNPFGRPLFQGMTYHDTPRPPLSAMRFVDKSASTGAVPKYSVRTINTVGLESKATSSR